jgi:hypothetical protein
MDRSGIGAAPHLFIDLEVDMPVVKNPTNFNGWTKKGWKVGGWSFWPTGDSGNTELAYDTQNDWSVGEIDGSVVVNNVDSAYLRQMAKDLAQLAEEVAKAGY